MVTAGIVVPLVLVLALGAPATLNTSQCVDVRGYGARGDGVTDDSDAIEAAVGAAIAGQKDFAIENLHTHVRQHNLVGGPDLCFSPGEYKITRTIDLSPRVDSAGTLSSPPNVRGLGKVNVWLNSTTIDMFSASTAFWWQFTGISMVGGRVQLLIGNNNSDQGKILVSDCAFQESSGAAVHMLPPAGPLKGFVNGTHPNGLPIFSPPVGQSSWRGSFSTQLTLKDSKFIECNQVLVNWGDWTTVQDIWVTTSPTMTADTAVFENWDRLFVKRVLAVSGTHYETSRKVAWFHNHAYRLSGGWLHMEEFRFSDDGGCSLLNIVNFAPLLCVPQHNPYDSNVLCATPEPGPLPKNFTWGQSSIIVKGGYLCGIPVAILLEQIPSQLVLRDTANLPGSVGRHIVAMGDGMQDLSTSGPNGATMIMAAKTPQALRYVFSDIWNGVPSTAGLPVELWPYISAHRVYANASPTAGVWKRGTVVWREIHTPSRYENGSIRVATYPQYEPFEEWEEQPSGGHLGWVCAEGGEPGRWVNISFAGAEQPAVAPRQTNGVSVHGFSHGDDEEKMALRQEVTGLRQMLMALATRLEALEKLEARAT